MDKDAKTESNILKACRRCDDCGVRAEIKLEQKDMCVLQCSLCGKEYPFYKSVEDKTEPIIEE
jgi:translation initiation factor 2 beta subunit (eIF-2beta)/eIF-5